MKRFGSHWFVYITFAGLLRKWFGHEASGHAIVVLQSGGVHQPPWERPSL